jgi:hypothetical protein
MKYTRAKNLANKRDGLKYTIGEWFIKTSVIRRAHRPGQNAKWRWQTTVNMELGRSNATHRQIFELPNLGLA